MKFASRISMVLLALALASPAFASFGHGDSDKSPSPPKSSDPTSDAIKEANGGNRPEAEKWYHDAFDDVQKGKSALEAKKDKDAEKRFRRALERGEKAVALDPKYYEAWNLLGYSARKLKDYDRAISSYQRCLAIKSDYAPAREYLGEAYLEMGKLDLAKEQLAAIDATKDSEDARTLDTAIADYVKAHPDAAGAAAGAATGAADSK
jgi:tetratricopeptide (TPR) repeat protein